MDGFLNDLENFLNTGDLDSAQTLVEGHKNAGVHELIFEAGGLSSGLYIYRVEADNLVVTKQMVLLE